MKRGHQGGQVHPLPQAQPHQEPVLERHSPLAWIFRFLAPPLAAAPALHHALQEQQLAAITPLDAVAAGDWLAALQRGDALLPVPASLLQTSPWRQAALTAVWPWEPLVERLWLLIPQELASHAAVLAVAARLRERIAAASR